MRQQVNWVWPHGKKIAFVAAAAAGAGIWIGTRAQIADHVLAQEAA